MEKNQVKSKVLNMKIVDRKTFLSLPDQTLFSKYEPCIFGPLTIKGDSLVSNDFLTQSISDAVKCRGDGEFTDILDDALETGISFEMDFDCMGRDGLFENDMLFAVWERDDIISLIERLKKLVTS